MKELATLDLRCNGSWIAALERPGHGTPLVLLHGVAGNALSFKPLIDRLPNRHIIAVDMPCHGRTGTFPSLELEDIATMIFDAVTDYIGEDAIWGGHSWGGKVAAIVAAQHPRAVDSLILLDPTPADEIAIPAEFALDAMFGPELATWNTLEEAYAAVRDLPQYANWDDDRRRAFERGLVRTADGKWHPVGSRENLIAIATALGKDCSELIRTIACPTLLIVSEQSLGWQETSNIALMPRAATVVVRSNHWLMADNPEAVANVIDGLKWLVPASEELAGARA